MRPSSASEARVVAQDIRMPYGDADAAKIGTFTASR
jgi:hypothetical protein